MVGFEKISLLNFGKIRSWKRNRSSSRRIDVTKPENRKKSRKLPSALFSLLLFCSTAKLKKQMDAEAHQNKMPILETTPMKGFIPVIAAGSLVNSPMVMPVFKLRNTTSNSRITIGV